MDALHSRDPHCTWEELYRFFGPENVSETMMNERMRLAVDQAAPVRGGRGIPGPKRPNIKEGASKHQLAEVTKNVEKYHQTSSQVHERERESPSGRGHLRHQDEMRRSLESQSVTQV